MRWCYDCGLLAVLVWFEFSALWVCGNLCILLVCDLADLCWLCCILGALVWHIVFLLNTCLMVILVCYNAGCRLWIGWFVVEVFLVLLLWCLLCLAGCYVGWFIVMIALIVLG